MTSLLVIIVLVLLVAALWQLTKIFDLTQVGLNADSTQVANDNDNNVHYLMFGFWRLFIYSIYDYLFGVPCSFHTPASEHGSDVDNLMNITWIDFIVQAQHKCSSLLCF
jgi:cytochrome c oxidase subunit 2